MNSRSTIITLVAALAVLSGAMGMTLTGAFSDQGMMTVSTNNVAHGLVMGHVTVEAHHADGELYAYREGANEVVDVGEQCILKMLFASTNSSGVGRGDATGTGVCVGKLVGAWDVIAIGTTGTDVVETNVHLGNETLGVPGLERAHASKTWTNTTGAANNNKIELTKTFTSTSTNEQVIRESGLFNSTTVAINGNNLGAIGSLSNSFCPTTHGVCLGEGMLAHKVFSAVTLANGDSITITWTFQVGN